MADLYFEVDAATGVVERLVAEAREQTERHVARQPELPIAATGRAFAQYGDRLQGMFRELHGANLRRLNSLHRAGERARMDVARLVLLDAQAGSAFGGDAK